MVSLCKTPRVFCMYCVNARSALTLKFCCVKLHVFFVFMLLVSQFFVACLVFCHVGWRLHVVQSPLSFATQNLVLMLSYFRRCSFLWSKEMNGCDILAVFKYISPFYAVVKDLLVSFKTGQRAQRWKR
jgi:hypothetical protein